jgi:hypothetical protein
MSETIVQCDECGTHGRRAADAAAPDFWFYIESVDQTFGPGGIYIVWACSEACRDRMWKRGPGRGVVDDDSSFRMRKKRARTMAPR